MANIIKRSQIAEEDLFKGIRDSAIKTQEEIVSLNTDLKNTAAILKSEIANSKFIDSASIDKTTKAFEKANATKKQSLLLEEQRVKYSKIERDSEIQLEKIKQEKLKTERQELINKQKLDAANNKNVKNLNDERNAYQRLVISTREQKNESKRLAAVLIELERAGKKNTQGFKDLKNEYREVTRAAQQGDVALKKIDSTVGDNFRNVGNYKGAITGLKNSLLGLGVAFSGVQIVRGAFDVLTEFDEKIADIQKTTGLAKEEANALSLALLEIDTRTSITSLQELASAAGRLGIEGKDNILGFVKSADEAFVALGDDLGGTAEEIATTLGKVASVFGDEAKFGIEVAIKKTGSAINELASNSKASAGAILDFTNRMAGVASQAGIAQTDIQALGALFDSTGQSVEVAASTLNVLLPKLSANQAKFAKTAGMTAEEFGKLLRNSPIEALKAVAKGAKSSEDGLDGLVATLGEFGVESARATGIIGVLASSTDELTRLQKVSNTAFDKGTSLTEEFNVKNNTLGGTMEKLSKEFQKYVLGLDDAGNVSGKFASILQFLVNNLSSILSIIGKATAAFVAYKTATLALRAASFVLDGGLKEVAKSFFTVKKNADDAKSSSVSMGSALKGLGWTALIALATDLAIRFYDIASGAADARREAELLAQANAQAEKSVSSITQKRKANLDEQKRLLDIEIRNRIVGGENAEKLAKEQIDRNNKLEESELKRLKSDGEIRKKKVAQLQEYQDFVKRGVRGGLDLSKEESKLYTADLQKKKEIEAFLKQQKGFEFTPLKKDQVQFLGKEINRLYAEIIGLNTAEKEFKDLVDESTVSSKEQGTVIADNAGKLSNLTKVTKENTDEKLRNKGVKFDVDGFFAGEDAILKSKQEFEYSQTEMFNEELLQLEIKNAENTGIVNAKIYTDRIAQELEFRLRLLDIEKQAALDSADTQLKRDAIEEEYRQKKILAQQASEKKQKDGLNQLNNAQENFKKDEEKADEEKKLDKEKSFAEDRKAIAQSVTDWLIKKSDERIAQLDKEIQQAEQSQQKLEELAKNGNIKAEQSLAELNETIAKAEQEKAKEAQKQQRYQLINAGLQTYNSKVAGGAENPLTETIRDIALLQQHLASIPAFYEGTDTTVANALGAPMMQGRDGYVVRVDGDEKILNPTLSAMTGSLTTSQIAKVAQDHLNGKLINKTDSVINLSNSDIASLEMLNKLDKIESTLRNLPQTNYNFEQLSENLFATIKHVKKGNTLIHHKYRHDA